MSEVDGGTAAARAAALVDLGREREAIPILEHALATRPDDRRLLGLLAQAQLELDANAAREAAERLTAVAPESHRGPLLAAAAEARLGNRRQAERHASHAVELAPGLANTHAQLAYVLAGNRRKYGRALAAAKTAVELAPEEPLGYVAAGNVELGRGRPKRAERWYRRALELEPTNRAAQVNLALTSRAKWRLDSALANVQSALKLDPQDALARRILEDTVYTTLLHLQWIVLALIVVVFVLQNP